MEADAIGPLTAEELPVEVPQRKSPGWAFFLSFLIPGLGQLYCRKVVRGGCALAATLGGLALAFSGMRPFADIGLTLAFVLWVFSFVDAYFTADEVNAGIDEKMDGHNPRVAAVLNLLTNGWGYFYLDEQGKGVAFFLILNIVRFLIPAGRPAVSAIVSMCLLLTGMIMAFDAYRSARHELQLWPNEVPIGRPARLLGTSRLPVLVPVGLASVLAGVVLILAMTGTIVTVIRAR